MYTMRRIHKYTRVDTDKFIAAYKDGADDVIWVDQQQMRFCFWCSRSSEYEFIHIEQHAENANRDRLEVTTGLFEYQSHLYTRDLKKYKPLLPSVSVHHSS